jgi:hypothetical protein
MDRKGPQLRKSGGVNDHTLRLEESARRVREGGMRASCRRGRTRKRQSGSEQSTVFLERTHCLSPERVEVVTKRNGSEKDYMQSTSKPLTGQTVHHIVFVGNDQCRQIRTGRIVDRFLSSLWRRYLCRCSINSDRAAQMAIGIHRRSMRRQ